MRPATAPLKGRKSSLVVTTQSPAGTGRVMYQMQDLGAKRNCSAPSTNSMPRGLGQSDSARQPGNCGSEFAGKPAEKVGPTARCENSAGIPGALAWPLKA